MRLLIVVLVLHSLLWATPGAPDLNFGENSIATTAINTYEWANTIAIQDDGKIIAAGKSNNGDHWNMVLVRYNSDGSRDSSFGQDGIVEYDLGNGKDSEAMSVAIQKDGKIVVAANLSVSKMCVMRFRPNGELDSDFNDTGIACRAVGSYGSLAYHVSIQEDSKILVAGYSGGDNDTSCFGMVRYTSGGSIDTSFNGGEVINCDITYYGYDSAVAFQENGQIVIVGTKDEKFALARYNMNGSLDTGFGVNGLVNLEVGAGSNVGTSVVIQSDGKIVAGGKAYNGDSNNASNYDFALIRLDINGSLDTGFGNNGMVMTDVSGDDDQFIGIAIQDNDKIIALGKSYYWGWIYIISMTRYTKDGKLDKSFGVDGIVTDSAGVMFDLALQKDGKIVLAGGKDNGNDDDVAVIRYYGDTQIVMEPIYYLLGL
jgi:uncharacterized delta-60 repeat protein